MTCLWPGWRALAWLQLALPAFLAIPLTVLAAESKPPTELHPGLLLTCTAKEGGATDTSVVPGTSLFVPEGGSPSPFLPAGPFQAEWHGFVEVDLRSDFFFQVQARGTFRMMINGQIVLRFSGRGNLSSLTRPIRLGKGTNSIYLFFESPAQGDSMMRLHWGELETMMFPVPGQALRFLPEGEAYADGHLQHLGRKVALERRCFHCHSVQSENPIPELAMDAPSFDGIGVRRRYGWMAEWIQNPRAMQPEVRMPRMVHGPNAREDAEAMAAYLSTLTTGGEVDFSKDVAAVAVFAHLPKSSAPVLDVDPDAPLYNKLHCVECHTKPSATRDLPGMIPLRHIARKFAPGKLAEYLRQPEAHYAWSRMPNFRLNEAEANELAAFLLEQLEAAPEINAPEDPDIIKRGQALVQTRGCLNCHSGGPDNKFHAPAFSELSDLEGGCLDPAADRSGPHPFPDFDLTDEERAALHRLAGVGSDSLGRHVPSDFAARQVESLQCARCHGKFDAFPSLDLLGLKLKPEWSAGILAGEVPYKPRPWQTARMPVFKVYAEGLAQGLSARHGLPHESPPEPKVNDKLARIGQQLVGKTGGFSCVSCHAVAGQPATEVFEVEGINLQYATDRLTPQYYMLWLLNPILLNPQTKMPMYFNGGESPITEVLDGKAEPQLEAIWHYLLLKDQMPPPSLGEF